MGTNFWQLDGEIWEGVDTWYNECTPNGINKHTTEREWDRKQLLLKPLVDFHNSINLCDHTHPTGIQIGEWEIDRVSKEIVNYG